MNGDGVHEGDASASAHSLAFERWYRTYHDRVLAQCMRMLADRAAAEDIVQETLLRAWVGRERMRDEDLGAWLTVVARNLCVSHIRRQKRVVLTDELPEAVDESADPARAVERLESRRAVRRAMRQVGERHRVLLFRREVEEVDYEELGAELGLTAGGTRAVLFRARRVLRDHLKAVGEGFSAVLLGIKVRLRDLRARFRNTAAALEQGATQTGVNLALAVTVSVSTLGGAALAFDSPSAAERAYAVPATIPVGDNASAIDGSTQKPSRESVPSSQANRVGGQPRGSIVTKPRVDARPYNRDDGSGYYDVDIAGTGFRLTIERQPNDGFGGEYWVEDHVFPLACEYVGQLCWSY